MMLIVKLLKMLNRSCLEHNLFPELTDRSSVVRLDVVMIMIIVMMMVMTKMIMMMTMMMMVIIGTPYTTSSQVWSRAAVADAMPSPNTSLVTRHTSPVVFYVMSGIILRGSNPHLFSRAKKHIAVCVESTIYEIGLLRVSLDPSFLFCRLVDAYELPFVVLCR
jgi:hypothetical protein